MVKHVDIAGRKIGPGHPCFIIAEAGVNHNGNVDNALALVDQAAASGADAVKFQTFQSEHVSSAHARKAAYQSGRTGPEASQLEMLKPLELSADAHRTLERRCRERGILFLSTPFDEKSVNLLNDIGVPLFKIGSGEITNWPLLTYIARKAKPIILSTGMSYLSEVDQAVRVIRAAGCSELILLHCVSNYPAAPGEVNLAAIKTLSAAFGSPVGYSDHTAGIDIAVGAVAMGACVIEKHFTLDRDLPGPDHRASLEPDELKALVRGIRNLEAAFGDGRKAPAPSEFDTRRAARRSLVLARDVTAGERIASESLTALRPGDGIDPSRLEFVLGRRVRRDIRSGHILKWEDLT